MYCREHSLLGCSDFHNLMGFTSKKIKIFSNMFIKKVVQLVKPFLANFQSSISKKILIYVLNDPQIFYFFFWI